MKKAKLLALLLAVVMVFSVVLVACQSEFTVTYYDSDKNKVGEEVVAKGGVASGSVSGWLLDGSLTTEDGTVFDLTTPITSNIGLYGNFYKLATVSYYYNGVKTPILLGSEQVHVGGTATGSLTGYTRTSDFKDADGKVFDISTPITGDISLYAEFTLDSTWVNDTGAYTWHAATTDTPDNWNYHVYETNAATNVLDYTSDTLYTFDYNEAGDGFEIVPSMASGMPVDVTSNFVGQYGIAEGDTGRVYQISLKHNLRYDNGDYINANSFVRSVQNLLNPDAANFRADDLYESGNMKILGAEAYLKQGKETFVSCAPDGVGEGDYTGWADGVSDDLAKTLYFNLENSYVGQWVIDYADLTADEYNPYIALYYALLLLGDQTRYQQVAALDGKTYAEICKDETMKALFDELVAGWCTDPDEEFGFFAYKHVWEDNIDFSTVGFSAPDDYTIQIVLINGMDLDFYLMYELCTSFFLVNNGIYEQCIDTSNGVYTNSYGTSVATFSGYGPYKLVEFTADSGFKFERNEYWHGYYEIEHVNQYQCTGITYQVVSDTSVLLEMFQKGELDGYSLQADDISSNPGYLSSKYTYFQDSESIWFVAINPDKAHYEKAAASATANAGTDYTVIKTPLLIDEFRFALSYSLNRTAFIAALSPTSAVAPGLISSVMVADVEAGIAYRVTDQAKQTLVNFWGLADSIGEGKDYEDIDEAIESITGYDIAAARVLFNTAYDKAVEAGYITEDMISSRKWVLQIKIGMPSKTSKFYVNGSAFLQKNWTDAVKGTPWEGHLEFVESGELGSNKFADALRNGDCDLLFGVGYSGTKFDPYSFMDVFCGGLQYDSSIDKSKVDVDIEIDGKVLRSDLKSWIIDCLQGIDVNATVVVDGVATSETVTVNAGVNAETELRLTVMAACEEAILNLGNLIPIMTDASASLRCMRIQYKTEDYILGLGRGGIQYYTFSMTDSEFTQFVKDQGGTLNYLVE